MDFSLNDEQKMMIDTIRRFIAEELHPLEDELDDKAFWQRKRLWPSLRSPKRWACTH